LMKVRRFSFVVLFLLGLSLGTTRLEGALSQDHFTYVANLEMKKNIVSPEEQSLFADHFLRQHFLPWTEGGSQYGRDRIQAFFSAYMEKIVANGSKRGKGDKIAHNARLSDYPSLHLRAITTDRIDIRGLPYHVRRNGGVNLILQASSVPRGTPLVISHRSWDRKWFFVETGFVCGWTQGKHIACVSDAFVEKWRNSPLICVVKDDGNYRVGELYPVAKADEQNWHILIPRGEMKKGARVKHVTLPRHQAALFPLPLTYANLARVANELTGKPYGWGGIGGERDCSSLLRDLFSPFGIWLPRHSSDQAVEGGVYVDLSKMTREEKKAAIIRRGIPYLTLLWIKGHVMLYLGVKDGRPVVFHSFRRAILQTPEGGIEERQVAKSRITALEGEDAPRDLMGPIRGMVMLVREGGQ